MIRRLCALFLMLACAFAPGLTAHEAATEADSCCCGAACACPPADCPPPPATPVRITIAADARSIEPRARAAKPAAERAARVLRWFLAFSDARGAEPLPIPAVTANTRAGGVALYRAHCSFLL